MMIPSGHEITAQPVDAPDVGMVQRRQHLGFALKPRQPVRVGREHLGGTVNLRPQVREWADDDRVSQLSRISIPSRTHRPRCVAVSPVLSQLPRHGRSARSAGCHGHLRDDSRRKAVPSGRTIYTSVDYRCSHMPGLFPGCESRSDVNRSTHRLETTSAGSSRSAGRSDSSRSSSAGPVARRRRYLARAWTRTPVSARLATGHPDHQTRDHR